jgi:hypothetical protein
MKRTILIPTDFSIESVKFLIEVVQLAETGSINVIFLHCEHLSDSIFDLLFASKKGKINALITPAFQDACKIIRNRYSSKINSMRVEIFNGYTQAAFQKFLEGNNVDEIFIPNNYALQPGKNSFDPMPFILKASVQVTRLSCNRVENIPEKNQLAELFLV